jgi:hypothetical protein
VTSFQDASGLVILALPPVKAIEKNTMQFASIHYYLELQKGGSDFSGNRAAYYERYIEMASGQSHCKLRPLSPQSISVRFVHHIPNLSTHNGTKWYDFDYCDYDVLSNTLNRLQLLVERNKRRSGQKAKVWL